MELKQSNRLPCKQEVQLLIVPYGIETSPVNGFSPLNISLLIVPYGIETMNPQLRGSLVYPFNCTLWN